MLKNKSDSNDRELFDLYLARVSQIDFVHSVRVDKSRMFVEALDEAKIALQIFSKHK